MENNQDLQYLLDYRNGKIIRGLGIGNKLDDHLVFKRGQLNIILGHDNVGKSYFINWYFLNLALRHKLKFIIYSGENKKAYIFRDFIQMYSGMKFKDISESKIIEYYNYLDQFFTFIPNDKLYKPGDLFSIFKDSGADIGLIDPFTALERDLSYEGNYNFLNYTRAFINETGMTIYINTHPTSESGRSGNMYHSGHDWAGHIRAPLKDHIEGGKAFLNRCDDMIVIHRLIKHESMKYTTMISVEKIKDLDTGGKHTNLDEPILCDFNSGLGFVINNIDSLASFRPKLITPNEIQRLFDEGELISTSDKIRYGLIDKNKSNGF
jgi:hypothetical protein